MNKIYKIVWNALLGIWVVASELAKGKTKAVSPSRRNVSKSIDNPVSNGKFRPRALALYISLASTGLLISPAGFAATLTAGTQAELSNAVNNAVDGDIIQLTGDITINTNITLSTLNKNVVIDGQGQYGLTVTATTTNGFTINGGTGNFTLQNMTKIDSANYYGMVTVNGSNTAVNVIYDNIDYLGSTQIIFMGANGGSTNSIMTFGNILNDVVVNDRGQEIGEVNNVAYTGRFHVTHTGNAYSFRNSSATNNTATMYFGPNSDVLINRTDGTLTATGTSAWQYTFADGAKFELISAQDVLSGTNNNRGIKIGTYDATTGFGAGASIILEKTNTGSILSGNAIDNATTNTTGYNIGATGSDDVIFNLGKDTSLATSAIGVSATKSSGSAGIYIRNAGKIAATTGISATQNGSGNTIVTNEGNINATTGVNATQNGSGTLQVNNAGTITSTTSGITVNSTATDKNITVNNTGGTINATGGSGVNVLNNAVLNLIGGVITTTNAANAVTISNTAAHNLSDLTINLNGTGNAISKSSSTNVTLANTTLNINDRIGFNDLSGLNFASSSKGNNTINVGGTGTGISTTNTALAGLNADALDINVTGAGVGIATTGGGLNLVNQGVNINVTNSGGTALTIADGSSNSTVIGKNVTINAKNATAIEFSGTAAKNFTNQGSVIGNVDFAGDAGHSITNSGILDGNLTAKGSGNNTLVLNNGSESRGSIELGNGANNVTINNGASLTSITTGSGDDVFTLNDMQGTDTYLGMINAGDGDNTLDINRSQSSLYADTSLQGFNNINLSDTTDLTLVDENNISSGNIVIDDTSKLQFGSAFQGDFSATLGHVTSGNGDGNVNVNNGANVKLTNTAANTFDGTWDITQGGTLTATNNGQLASNSGIELGGILNLEGLDSLNNVLTGNGTLNIDANNGAFNFGTNTGAGFSGITNLGNSQFTLSGNNTTALTQSKLSVNSGAAVTVTDKNQAIGGLVLNGGTTVFDNGSIATDALSVTNTSTVKVNPEGTQQDNLLDQNAGVSQQLVSSSSSLSADDLKKLTLQDLAGDTLGEGTNLEINQGSNDVATGTYNYELSGTGGLSIVAQLIKVALAADQSLTLDTKESSAKTFTAQITGSGNLALNASGETLTLNNADNDYTGTTTINSGTVVAGSNNALGATSGLTTLAGSGFNLSGKNQTINGALTNAGTVTVGENGTLTSSSLNNSGTVALAKGAITNNGALTNTGSVNIAGGTLTSGALTNSGTVNLGGGTLTLSNGGASTSEGGLAGSGSLLVSGGTLTVSKANSGLTANTSISDGAGITLTDTGSLGSGTVNVGGDLNLNSTQTLANVLSGGGTVNTGGVITLSGNNTGFTGSQNIGTDGQLTVSSGANLGADTVGVNLKAAGAELVLNGVKETLNHILSGVINTVVSVKGGSATILAADNTDFFGNYAVSGSSSLQIGNTSNLGSNASVSLAAASDILRLTGFSGVFANSVSGLGQLVLYKSNATLNNTQKLDSSVGVNIGSDSTLTLASQAAFNHALTGSGTLSIDADNQDFAFGANTGSAFSGQVNFDNGQLALSGSTSNNSTALTGAVLSVDKGATVDVTGGDQSLGGLTLNGGTTVFNNGTINTKKLQVAANGVVQVDPLLTQTGKNLLDQNVQVSQQLVHGSTDLSAADIDKLTLTDLLGKELGDGSEQAITEGNNNVATGTYNYGLSGSGGLSTVARLVKVALTAGQVMTLNTSGSIEKVFTALITGSGNLALNASGETLTLNNAGNDYTGTTTINSGTVVAGSNNALGATSGLTTLAGSRFNLSGKTQTINGALTNAGTVNLGGGTLALNNGGTSSSVGGLAGNGSLQVTGGELTVSKANSGLTASTTISKGAAVTLTDTGSLGTGAVSVGGDLNLDAAQTLANVLSGDGAVNTGSAVTLSGSNTAFTGSQNIGTGGQLSVSSGANLGTANTVNLTASGAELVLNAVKETLNQVLTGVAGTTVSVKGAGATVLGANNTGFAGNYAVSGSSSLQASNASNLGTGASVSLATATDLLRLAGYSGIFANTVNGAGQLVLNNGATVALNSANVADTVGVNISTNSILSLSSLDAFNHALTGGGTLSIDADDQAFTFGANTGSAFGGQVNFGNGQLALSGSTSNNSTALSGATLSVDKDATVNVTGGDQSLGGLTLNGGTTVFNNGTINTKKLQVAANGIVQVDPLQTQTDKNLLDQNVQVSQQLVHGSTDLSADDVAKLTLTDLLGNVLGDGSEQAITEGNNNVATGTYNYGLSGSGGLSTVARLVKVALTAGEMLTLDTAGSNAKIFTALITGSGNLGLSASGETLTLNNAGNDYTGTTTINSGTVVAGSNNALGATSGLSTLAGSGFNLNGKTQAINGALTNAGTVTVGENGTLTSSSLNNSGTVALAKGAITNNGALTNTGGVNIAGGSLTSGALTNSGTVNLGGGTLALNNGGTSSSVGGLAGNGSLQVTGGELTVSKANSGLTASTTISKGAAVTLTDTGSLGTGAVSVGGDLNLDAAQTLANVLSGDGAVNTGSAVT
ncbi:ESPR-type extended signal peptide-containing protein, partial [Citrobacter sp. JGM124]|uniref:ESPR-type extended signal peptide-containing protein n=1 Tax=Citrobacter sp. JGM124 TaxID=2799789 RepID=UPI001BC08C93